MNIRPSWVFLYVKKQKYQGEIALVTNLRPLMSEQLLKFGYISEKIDLTYLTGDFYCLFYTQKAPKRGEHS